ncbi:hypothetical protein SARC_11464 [Sphaeroforma arctica JP610]|uniref:Integrase catalytic domain-containing protein n=1 Tax=Sphaeroforma arctica JP610 TaxID=667725 RepID=A0A0L0FGY9_9EUKA|nr:hypothetical protein SARC_11464 [Sphaeroforma arctica JP610]KNC76020.1 hypothetical protein SARC_11464 [Sphaeroforma arctica JP610]|eukprot:XP_014149922.1 hypothetical protein SARC_11464 [Sphaeroforma arctica JP610]
MEQAFLEDERYDVSSVVLKWRVMWCGGYACTAQPERPDSGMTEIGVDFVQFPTTNACGMEHALLVVDTLARMVFVWVFPPSVDAGDAVRFLEEQQILALAVPHRNTMDVDSVFSTNAMANLCEARQIEPHYVSIDRHQGNGSAEVLIWIMKDWLKREVAAANVDVG